MQPPERTRERTMKRLNLITLGTMLALSMLASMAVRAEDAPAKPSEAPPKLEKLEEGDQGVLIRKEEGTKITDQRQADYQRQTKVKTPHTQYTVRPNTPAGSSLPGDAQSSPNRAAEFSIMQFDLGTKKKKDAKTDEGNKTESSNSDKK